MNYGKTILVVEDDEQIRGQLALILGDEYEVYGNFQTTPCAAIATARARSAFACSAPALKRASPKRAMLFGGCVVTPGCSARRTSSSFRCRRPPMPRN